MSRILVCVAGVFLAWAAQGAPFADPTRPPDAAPGGPAPGGPAPGGSLGPRLQSVLIAPDRRLAIISGQQVRLGEKFGAGRVVRITESEVVISSGQGTRTLKLLPGAEKRLRSRP